MHRQRGAGSRRTTSALRCEPAVGDIDAERGRPQRLAWPASGTELQVQATPADRPAGVSTSSMRPAYCERIQSSLKRLGTRSETTADCPFIGHVGRRQRADPGVELLFGQFGGQLLATALPEVVAHCGQVLFGASAV